MSTVEGYAIDMYCDGPDCRAHDQVAGRTQREAKALAAKKGWVISLRPAPPDSVAGGRFVLCPKCRKASKMKDAP